MVKYIISKELQTDEINYESEDIGVFDTEEEAVQKAKTYYDELPDHEQQFYEICVWRVSGDRLDPNDWDTVEEGEEVAAFMAETNRYDDEQWDEYGEAEELDPEWIVHFCISPRGDGVRVWIGEGPEEYVDSAYVEGTFDPARALAGLFEQYGRFAEEDWKEHFPETNRRMYLEHITDQGYSDDEAAEILRYLPQTTSELVADNVIKMIGLWKAKARVINPYRTPKWKKAILEGQEDLWTEEIRPNADHAQFPDFSV